MGGGKIRERAIWERGLGWGYTVYEWRENQGKGHMGERVGVGIYSKGKSGKGPYGREGWGRDIQYMSGGKIRERAIWERGLG